jgi:predicted nucleic acid-binding protein
LTRLVLDASAAIQVASLTAMPVVMEGYELLAPPLLWSESLSALAQATFRGEIPTDELDRTLARLEALPIAQAGGDSGHRRRSLEIARSLGWAKSYDAEYVALAESLACPLLTIDRRLIRGARALVDLVGPGDLVRH